MPRAVHEHFAVDPDDPENGEKHILTGYTVITRESPWDDKSRARALALTEYESSLCGCGCGLPREVASKKQDFVVHEVVCYASKAVESLKRAHREKHKDNDSWFDGRQYVAVPAVKKDAVEKDPDAD